MAPPPAKAHLVVSQTEASSPGIQRSEKSDIITTAAPIFPPNLFRTNQYASLLYLPMELQFLIYSHLSYGDLQSLRRANRYFRQLISIDFIRICLGSPATDAELRFVCRSCMRYDPDGLRLVWPCARRAQPDPITGRINPNADASDDEDEEAAAGASPPDYPGPTGPFSALCAACAIRAGQLSPGEYVLMEGGERKVRICRWCGWPCNGNAEWGKELDDYTPQNTWELHPRCSMVYQVVLVSYYLFVCVRSGIALVSYILLWRCFPDDSLVVVPSIIGFLIMGIILVITYMRGRKVRTYHVVGSLEFSVLALGIPPLVVIIKTIEQDHDATIIAAEILHITHLIIRLINIAGNILLFLEYDVTRHHAPDVPPHRKYFLNPLIAGLIFWTSPQALENLWIGRGKRPKNKSLRRGLANSWARMKRSLADYGGAQGHAMAAA